MAFWEPACCPHTHHGQDQPQPWSLGQMSEALLCMGFPRAAGRGASSSHALPWHLLTCPSQPSNSTTLPPAARG